MGLKIQNSSFPPFKVIISKKLHILRPALDCFQCTAKPREVRNALGILVCCLLWSCIKIVWSCLFVFCFFMQSMQMYFLCKIVMHKAYQCHDITESLFGCLIVCLFGYLIYFHAFFKFKFYKLTNCNSSKMPLI